MAMTQAKIDAALKVNVDAIGMRSSCHDARDPAVRPAAYANVAAPASR
jgi:hypothetical protein